MYLCLFFPQRLLKNFHHQDPMDYLQSILYNIDRIYTSKVIFCLFYFSKLADIHQFKKKQAEKKCVCVCVGRGAGRGQFEPLFLF